MNELMVALIALAFGLVMGTNVLNARRFGRWGMVEGMTINTYQPGPYEPGPQGNDTIPEGCGTIVLEGAALLGTLVFAALAWLLWWGQ